MHHPPFCCFFSSESVCENTLGRCYSTPAWFGSYSRQKWSPWLSSHVFQLAVYFRYQPICELALAVQWGFFLLELWLVFFSLCCNFSCFWKTNSNTLISYASYWILETEEDRNTCRTRMKNQRVHDTGKSWMLGYLDITCTTGVVDTVEKIEGKHNLKWTQFKKSF